MPAGAAPGSTRDPDRPRACVCPEEGLAPPRRSAGERSPVIPSSFRPDNSLHQPIRSRVPPRGVSTQARPRAVIRLLKTSSGASLGREKTGGTESFVCKGVVYNPGCKRVTLCRQRCELQELVRGVGCDDLCRGPGTGADGYGRGLWVIGVCWVMNEGPVVSNSIYPDSKTTTSPPCQAG